MKHELAILALWAISIVATLILLEGTAIFTYLGPVYGMCMIGSVLTVRSARASATAKKA